MDKAIIVDRLVKMGHHVSVVDNFLTGSKENLNEKAKYHEADISDLEDLDRVFSEEKPEYIFHVAAGYLVQSLENPQRDAKTNIIGTINIIQLCLKYNIKKVIYSNSGGASYGNPQQIPIPETHSIHPLTPYGASKYAGELYFDMYYKNHGLKYTSLRYGNVYGPRQRPELEGGVISVFLDALIKKQNPVMKSDGTPVRDYIFVDDVVDANILAMSHGDGEAYHVASGKGTSVLELYGILQKVLNTNINYVLGKPRVGDPQKAIFDISKIKKELGWEPKVSLEEGTRATAEWLKNRKND